MKTDKDTREKLLVCAKEEFMEKGFQNASLRKICSKASVTTGAVYFFFGDKDGLLGGLVDGVYQNVMGAIDHHLNGMSDDHLAAHAHKKGDHDLFVEELVHALYQDRDVVVLLLSKAAGSKYENVVDDVIALVESRLGDLIKKYADSVQGKQVNGYMIHWLSHLSVMSFVHALTHIEDEEEALEFMKPAMDHLILGWTNYILEDAKE
jgi:AcrR family transcriptional regulator